MIPKYLNIEHFLSYRQSTELDLRGLSLVLLSGDNGAGKSSLLEAMTWALWGKARSPSDDDLVSRGETSMTVELVFEEQGREFRVLRQRTLGNRGKTRLDFWSRGHDSDEWLLQNGISLRQTEAIISERLKLSYATFTNSVYLRQGHADEFTTKPASERKKVLADILDLERFDRLAERAREEARFKQQAMQLAEQRLADTLTSADMREELETQGRALKQTATEQATQTAALEAALQPLMAAVRERSLIEQKLQYIERELSRQQRLKDERTATLRGIEAKQTEVQRLLEQQAAVQIRFERIETLTAEQKVWQNKAASQRELERTLAELRQRLAVLVGKRQTETEALKGQIAGVKERQSKRAAAISTSKQCPLCTRPFSTEHTADQCVDAIRTETLQQINPLITQVKALSSPSAEEAALTETISQTEDARQALNYRETAHRAAASELEQLQPVVLERERLASAAGKQQELQTEQAQLTAELGELTEHLQSLAAERQTVGAELAAASVSPQEQARLSAELSAAKAATGSTERELGRIQGLLATAVASAQTAAALTKQLTGQRSELHVLEEFAQACSRHGIPTLILEETLPLLEERANQLLYELSGGTMTLTFETERAKKSGEGTIDTLDILIADLEGTRPYELYSGGEAFRINMAIRVALSLLLAERAGAEIEFLIIDEGFGALDQAGRDAVVQVLNQLRTQFKQIIIVTHLLEFKELFDQEIVVTKDEQGSHLTIRV